MKRKSCSFLALFLAFSLFSCTNDNSVNSGSIEPSVSASTTNSGSTSSSGSQTSVPHQQSLAHQQNLAQAILSQQVQARLALMQ